MLFLWCLQPWTCIHSFFGAQSDYAALTSYHLKLLLETCWRAVAYLHIQQTMSDISISIWSCVSVHLMNVGSTFTLLSVSGLLFADSSSETLGSSGAPASWWLCLLLAGLQTFQFGFKWDSVLVKSAHMMSRIAVTLPTAGIRVITPQPAGISFEKFSSQIHNFEAFIDKQPSQLSSSVMKHQWRSTFKM